MYKLKEMIGNSKTLSERLKENGSKHKNYKMYTSIEKALEFYITGYIYLSDGCVWNDGTDRKQMEDKGVYAKSMSFSTKENVAMWMLYGKDRGKQGALINITGGAIIDILKRKNLEVVRVYDNSKIDVCDISIADDEYEIFMTDVVYINETSTGIKATYYDYSCDIGKELISDDDIFTKKYEWQYENETRLVVRPHGSFMEKINSIKKIIENDNNNIDSGNDVCDGKKLYKSHLELRVNVNKKFRKNGTVVKSPIYKYGVNFGESSSLDGEVFWE